MILTEYTHKINTSECPRATALRITTDLNKNDPLYYYTVTYTNGLGYSVEKFGIKGMKWKSKNI